MINTAFVLMALVATPAFSSPIPANPTPEAPAPTPVAPAPTPVARDVPVRRAPLKLPKIGGGAGGGASGVLGPAIQGALGAAGILGAQGLENANQQDIASKQLDAATAAAAQASPAPARRAPLRIPTFAEIINQGGLTRAGTLGAQAAAPPASAPAKRYVIDELD